MRSRRLSVLSFSGRSSERLSGQRWPSASWSVLLGLPVLLGLSGCLQEVDKPKYSADYDTAAMALDVTWLIDYDEGRATTQQQMIVQMAADGQSLVLSDGEVWNYKSSMSDTWKPLKEFRVGNQRSYQANWNGAVTDAVTVRFTRHSGEEYEKRVSRPEAIEGVIPNDNDRTRVTVSFNEGHALKAQSLYRCTFGIKETRWVKPPKVLSKEDSLYRVPFDSAWQNEHNECWVTVSLQRESGVTKPSGFADGRVQSVLQHTLAPIMLFSR
ncbi:MAG: hypothetical protein IBX52_12265 [Bacterioplanes sp.]|nr:hypothetical protein [Bacterioplanes sp.]